MGGTTWGTVSAEKEFTRTKEPPQIPDIVAEAGKGGRFDTKLAEKYAFEVWSSSSFKKPAEEFSKYRTHWLSSKDAKSKKDALHLNKFMIITVRKVREWCTRKPGQPQEAVRGQKIDASEVPVPEGKLDEESLSLKEFLAESENVCSN
ncbi:hypothetical protein BDV18DRAFT_160159 [Aspergillus unguis]